jgi:hypothetical protein
VTDGVLTRAAVEETASWIASAQLRSGLIPWFPGGHADPWNHTEAAMALVAGGLVAEAEAAYRWLGDAQLADGSWCLYYLADGVEEPRRDPNVCAYIATGVWWHHAETGDRGFLVEMWPVVRAAIDFVVGLQLPRGEIAWSRDVDGTAGRFALLTGNASILHSLRCAIAIANMLGEDCLAWEISASRLRRAILHRPDAFADKSRWAMDWYYPVLSGALGAAEASARLASGWQTFVMPGVGIRCVADQPWVTAAETSECVIAFDVAGRREEARALLRLLDHFRDWDGAYWTGCVHPECVRYPGAERSTYTAAAVMIANHIVGDLGRGADLFRGTTMAPVIDLDEPAIPADDV